MTKSNIKNMERINLSSNNSHEDNNSHSNHQDNYFIHLARYMFCARQLDVDDEVLEIGCGTGYGASLLSDFCKNVVATDLGYKDLIDLWSEYNKRNLKFVNELPDKKFDTIASFEVVEHIHPEEVNSYFVDIKNHLKDNGSLFISTPRYIPYEERSQNRKDYHLKEYTYDEYKELLNKHFHNVFIFSQNDSIISMQNPKMAWNFVAICTGKKI